MKSKQNPFTLSFGKEPLSFIHRDIQTQEILQSFLSDHPSSQVYMITGVRGQGKTVLLSSIANQLSQKKDWVVVNLNPERDLLHMLTAELSNRRELMELFRDAKINLSFLGFGLEIDGEPPVTDVVVALRRMLQKLTDKGKKVLVTIDEISPSRQVREFSSQFQIFLRENLNIFLLMTGLYENIHALQNEKTLTFLYRAPKIDLKPLSLPLIGKKYQETLGVTEEDAFAMAQATCGYSFAFQVLGYLCWVREEPWRELIPEYDTYLEEYVYEKIWSELSRIDKNILVALSNVRSGSVTEIRRNLKIDSNNFTVYRSRLIRKGIVTSPEYGYLAFTLPRFREFVHRNGIQI